MSAPSNRRPASGVRPRILINAVSVTAGGGRAYIRNLLRELAKDDRGFDFTIFCAPDQLSEDETCGLPRVTLELPAGKGPARSVLRPLYEEVALPFHARHFDLLYCIADLAPAWCPVPTVVALRNLNIYDRRFFNDIRVKTLERLVRLGVRRASRVLFPTRAASDQVRQRIPIDERRVRIVPHGIAGEVFEGLAIDPPADTRYLFLPAAVEPHKNVETLVAAIPHFEDRELEVWIAGSMDNYPDYVATVRGRIAKSSLEDRVKLLGPVPYERILHYYRGAQAMIFPSLLESFGHPLLEAMLAETPILASDIGSLREVAGDVARYFDPNDPMALAAAVNAHQREPEAAQARVALGRERALQFSWKRSTDRLCAVFEEVLAGG